MTEAQTAEQRRRLDRELSDALDSMYHWDQQADVFADRAADMLRVARELDRVSEPIPRILHPIRDLHTSATWEGDAAVQSRRRLDAHEDQTISAIRKVDRLIDDLRADAQRASFRESEARDHQRRARRTAAKIEIELGAFNTIHI